MITSNYFLLNVTKMLDHLKQQVKEVKAKICERAGKLVDAAKRKGQRALYKITQVTGMRKKLDAIKNKVDRAIDRVENLERAVGECRGQQGGNPIARLCGSRTTAGVWRGTV